MEEQQRAVNQKPWWDEIHREANSQPVISEETHEAPLILISQEAQGTRISALSEEARSLGLWLGQKLGDARAMMPNLRSEHHDQKSDSLLLQQFGQWKMRYTPSVALNKGHAYGENGLLLDIAGCDHLFGGEHAMCHEIIERFQAMGFSCRIGVADTPSAAMALSDFGSQDISILPVDDRPMALFDFPVDALRLDTDTIVLLKRLGLKTIGSVLGIPRAALERRFRERSNATGKSAFLKRQTAPSATAKAVQLRLDQLTGHVREPLNYLVESKGFIVRQNCPEMAQDYEAVETILKYLLPELCHELEKAGRGALTFVLTGFRADGGTSSVHVALSVPSHDFDSVARLFKDKFDRIDCGFGLDLLTLTALQTQTCVQGQNALLDDFESGEQSQSIAYFADTLRNRIEGVSVYGLTPKQSHVPERAQTRTNPSLSSTSHKKQKHPIFPRPQQAPRPARLFERPEPAHVVAPLPDGPPAQFVWRRLQRRVVRARGPERILPEWWSDTLRSPKGASIRDYYDVEDASGQRYWIYRAAYSPNLECATQTTDYVKAEPTPFAIEDMPETQDWRWFVHGLY